MPNMKTKKFDFSILLASLSIVLVICCAVVCCVIGIDSDNQVAQAYTNEEIGVSNLEFTVDEGFYLIDLWELSDAEIERYINYYFYFIPDLMNSNDDFYYILDVGRIIVDYIDNDGYRLKQFADLYLELSKTLSDECLNLNVCISVNSELYFFEFAYNFIEGYVDEYVTFLYNTEYDDYYYINFLGHPEFSGIFANQLALEIFDDVNEIYSIDALTFEFYNSVNLGCFFSPNTTFANPPVVLPEGVYNDNLDLKYNAGFEQGYEDGSFDAQDNYEPIIESLQNANEILAGQLISRDAQITQLESQITELESQITELESQISNRDVIIADLRAELEYYRSLDLNYQQIQVFNIARVKPSTFVYDGVTYTSNTIQRTNAGWDVYSTTYLNQQLPDNYGVGFSLFLEETISNTIFHIYPDILSYYNYTYCSPPDEQGAQECYQVTNQRMDFSVGYRTQNGNIVKIGEFTNAPGMTTGDFVINQPTNEIVFFREESNLMKIGEQIEVLYYQYDTQSIYDAGYENGKSQGLQIGREQGYNQGVVDANDYSFFSLFTSVFDAPITAIVGKWGDSDGDGVYQREGGMLNFYIPGLEINFAPFLLSLFTIAIIILVIRFIMARKS